MLGVSVDHLTNSHYSLVDNAPIIVCEAKRYPYSLKKAEFQ